MYSYTHTHTQPPSCWSAPSIAVRSARLTALARNIALLALVLLAAGAFLAVDARAAQPPVGLGTAESFGVLAGSTVTNTGPSVINGDLGLHPGSDITGFPPGTVNGTIHATNAVAAQAKADLRTAYNDAAGRTPAAAVPADLGGRVLTAGVYRSATELGLTGALTLDAQGDPNAVFIFQAGSTLTTASASSVNLINGAQACNVFWQVGSSATLGSASVFAGNILALTSISMNNGVTMNGRALARNGAVTLINDTITVSRCAGGGGTSGDAGGSGTARISSPSPGVGPGRCVDTSFRATVSGNMIRRVVFSVGGVRIANRTNSPFTAVVRDGYRGGHTVLARVTFRDSTPARRLRLRFQACAAASRQLRRPAGFTG